jgi:FKBP-type peptidyl-prolyl cis-trans isomerase FklB
VKMKYLIKTIFVCVIMLTSFAYAADVPQQKAEAWNRTDSLSYSIGLNLGSNFKKMDVEINPDIFLKGLKDGVTGSEPALSEEEIRNAMDAFQKERKEKQKTMMAEQQKKLAELAEKNKEEGEKFLAENTKKEGVVTTASGLQYIVLKEGKGEKPNTTDTVTVNYKGTLLDGTEFDSSYKRGEPASFPLNGVIKGWTEGLQLMSPGAQYRFFIPSDLAYGKRGGGKDIGPDATLVFEVELLKVAHPPVKAKTGDHGLNKSPD